MTVTVEADHDGHSTVQVTYALTALSSDGDRELERFAAGYPAFLASWEEAIARRLTK